MMADYHANQSGVALISLTGIADKTVIQHKESRRRNLPSVQACSQLIVSQGQPVDLGKDC
jgi:hypothetical protein